MLTSFVNTQSEILKILTNNGTKTFALSTINGTVNIPITYARDSAHTNAQKSSEDYPKVIIYDYNPEYDIDWNPNHQPIVDGYHDFTGTNNAPKKAYIFKEPLRFLLRYDHTVFVKNPMHRFAVMDHMEKTYSKTGSFCLNKTTFQDGSTVGDYVTYTISPTENERSDGIFELNYEFTIKAFINLIDAKEVDLISNFNLNINPII